MKLERQDQIGILYIDTDRNNCTNGDFIREAHKLMNRWFSDETQRLVMAAVECMKKPVARLRVTGSHRNRALRESMQRFCTAPKRCPNLA